VIEADRPQPVQLDGNAVEPTDRLEVHVEPGVLRLVRAPAVTVNGRLAAAPVAALSRGAGIAWQLVAGAAAASFVFLRVRASRAIGHRPGLIERHPFLIGLTAGALVSFLKRRRRTTEEVIADAGSEEEREGREK
jgi:hypothetical protein